MSQFFLRLLFGNLVSKALFIAADGVAALALTRAEFGVFVLLQGLIISGAIVGAWGRDQAIVSLASRSGGGGALIRDYLLESRSRVFVSSLLAVSCILLLIHFSNVELSVAALILVSIAISVQAQLTVNAAALRVIKRAHESVLYFDGIRNIMVFLASLAALFLELGVEVFFCGWVCGVLVSLVLSSRRLIVLLASQEGEPLTKDDFSHARGITVFMGILSVSRLATAQLVVVVSAYILTPEQLGTVGFYMKILSVFTFIQTIMVQAISPVIGRLGKTESLGEARKTYFLTTLFLAATATPLVGGALLAMPWIAHAFEMDYTGLMIWTLPFFFFAHALNIGTGIIGQFLIHFGRAKALLIISIGGSVLLFGSLVWLGSSHGVDGVLLSHALVGLLILAAKHLYSARAIGVHGFGVRNLLLVAAGLTFYLLIDCTSFDHMGFHRATVFAFYLAIFSATALPILQPVFIPTRALMRHGEAKNDASNH